MFRKAKNIDSAFKGIRSLALIIIVGLTILSACIAYLSLDLVKTAQGKIYVLVNGKALEAYAADRKENIPVEARDHIKTFHQYFFTLSPDEKFNQSNIRKALYLADESAKQAYDNLRESNYYSNVVSGNVSQTVTVDSILVNTNAAPYTFRFYGRQEITRPTSITIRNLITEGQLRVVNQSDNNAHGFLIEKWTTIANDDLSTKTR
ncbi:MAG: conjugative transposon protein TraK [Sphingobacterium sp.]|jgi:conjugative transposon TraK protein|nr:conjugative transposon protein TraK [Sphingobacterium sp.]